MSDEELARAERYLQEIGNAMGITINIGGVPITRICRALRDERAGLRSSVLRQRHLAELLRAAMEHIHSDLCTTGACREICKELKREVQP